MADFAGIETRSRRNKDPGGDLVTLGVDYVLRPSSVSLVKRRRASLRATYVTKRAWARARARTYAPVIRGGWPWLYLRRRKRHITLNLPPLLRFVLGSDFSRSSRARRGTRKKSAPRLFRPVTHFHEARPFAIWITLRIVMRSSHHLPAKLLELRRCLSTRHMWPSPESSSRICNAVE